MEKVKDFFEFEIENGLFDIEDNNGLIPWDGVRYYVMMNVLHDINSPNTTLGLEVVRKKLLYTIQRLVNFVFYYIRHRKRDFLFILCSRDKKDGLYYDKIADGIYNVADKSSCFTIETTDNYLKSNYKYSRDIGPLVDNVIVRMTRCNFDFSHILSQLKEKFPQATIRNEELNGYYKRFVGQYKFYRWLIRHTNIKKIWFVQNNIMKGLMAAANKEGVELYEIQHGQISLNHPAYSYPSVSLLPSSKVYHPDHLLTFGRFWSKNRSYPGVKDLVIGNTSYAEKMSGPITNGNKKMLVISNLAEGPLLVERVKEVLKKDPDFFFYFKLHPNQFKEFETYKNTFDYTDCVEVVSNQQTVNELLLKCEGVFLNDSTVELEALRLGRKVFVLTEQFYEVMDFVLGEEGVYACKDVDEFLQQYESHKNDILNPREDLFEPFNEETAKQILEKNDNQKVLDI